MITARLKKAMGKSSQREFARKLNISPSTLWEYMKGRVPPSDFIVRVCEQTGVSERWLLSGKGEMFIEESGKKELDDLTQKIIRYINEMNDEEKKDVLRYVEDQKLLRTLRNKYRE